MDDGREGNAGYLVTVRYSKDGATVAKQTAADGKTIKAQSIDAQATRGTLMAASI